MPKRTAEDMINEIRDLLEPVLEVLNEATKQDIVINFSIGQDAERRHVIQSLATTKNYPTVRPVSH